MNFFYALLAILWLGIPAEGLRAEVQPTPSLELRGWICDASDQKPLRGATVQQKNTRNGTSTDTKGQFLLKFSADLPVVLQVRHVGFETAEFELTSAQLRTPFEGCLTPVVFKGNEILVQSVRASQESAVTQSNMDKATIETRHTGRDMPYLLEMLPSVVTTSDAGAGVGYTGLRIRGIDQARINVTINGIPLNDPESHEVFWVNMPDFAGSLQSLQVQRGVGSSTHGAGAFGASLNLLTEANATQAYGNLTTGLGSFNTRRISLETGTGLLRDAWSVDGRLSMIQSDGYIDRAFSDLNSWYVNAARVTGKSMLKVNVFSGKEKTYQAWNGVPEEQLDVHRRFNEFTYENQTDNYRQTHTQLHYSLQASPGWTLHTALHYTKGSGFYEEFKQDQALPYYGIEPVVIRGVVIDESDLIRRRWLDNDFYGMLLSSELRRGQVSINLGGAFHIYDGDHFGEVIWARFASSSTIRHRYYDNNGFKQDGNGYTKITWQPTASLSLMADLQVRFLNYAFEGLDQGGQALDQEVRYRFFNPKFGANYRLSQLSMVYLHAGVAHKEPTRKEFTDSTPDSRPKPERLNNLELGWRIESGTWRAGVGAYWMDYVDQLILTGQINDVGSYVRQNVPKSYRLGMEVEAQWGPVPRVVLAANATMSKNRIRDFVEYLDLYEAWDWKGQQAVVWGDRPMAFSPAQVAQLRTTWSPWQGVRIELAGRHVGVQYLDNTGQRSRSLDPYTVADLQVAYRREFRSGVKAIELQASVLNATNRLYESNGYTYGWLQDGQRTYFNYYYPQAGRHLLAQLRVVL